MNTDDNARQIPRFVETANDKFEILGQLGRGGMGVVYKAYQFKMDRVVALKLISVPHNATTDTLMRFQREASACGSVNHPAVLKIFAVDVYESMPLIVMEYVEGNTLAQVIEQNGKVAPDTLLRITANLLDGLAAVHAAGFVHRDIKPPNIIVTADGIAKLMDFGIAKMLDTTGAGDYQRLTQTGAVLGSPMYMSPEQCAAGAVDFRSDIYSLGCTMYEASCGAAPFQGHSTFELLFQHLEAPPPSLPDTVPEDLADIIFKAMSKRPEDRFQSAEAFNRALSHYSAGTYQRTAKRKSRHWFPRVNLRLTLMIFAALVIPTAIGAFVSQSDKGAAKMTDQQARALINNAKNLRQQLDSDSSHSAEQKQTSYRELAFELETALGLLGENELDSKFRGTESLAQILERCDKEKAARVWLSTAKLADERFSDELSAKKRLEYYQRAIYFLQNSGHQKDAIKLVQRISELQRERGPEP